MEKPKLDREKQIRIFDKQAEAYAKRRYKSDMALWRRQLIADAYGDVLELAVGAGANFSFYRKDVRLTAVDFSSQMMEKAKEAAAEEGIQTKWLLSDVEAIDFPEHSFDTVVSTMSFCSYRDPAAMLAKVNRWCRPGGSILLMEHGRSTSNWIAALQKWIDPLSCKFAGCYQSRDLRSLLAASDLSIRRLESRFMNIVLLVWASPGPEYKEEDR